MDIVFTGVGMLSGAGDCLDQHVASLQASELRRTAADYSMRGFKPAPYLSDRRTLKSVSSTDALGIAAIELLKKDAGLTGQEYDPDRFGLYVGAPPSSPWNVSDYFDAIRASRDPGSGSYSQQAFGKEAMSVRPTTLLAGLPNNVLCYGAIVLAAKGPNSNYTSGEISGQIAVINAAKRMALGKLDAAAAGGFSAHGEPVVESMLAQNGLLRAVSGETAHAIEPGKGGTVLAEGATFFLMEKRDAAEKRGARILATYVAGAQASAATGHFGKDNPEQAIGLAVRRCLSEAKIQPGDVGLVFTSTTGIGPIDDGEERALTRFFAGTSPMPAVGTVARLWGNLMEAGGLGEIAMLPMLRRRGTLPEAMRLNDTTEHVIDGVRPYALIVRTSVFGDVSCLLVKSS